MGQTLTHGIYLPDEGERNCYNGLAANWQLLDGAVGTVASHTTQIAGKAPLVHTHTKSDVTDLLNSNFIPSANNSYDLGSSSYQWKKIYSADVMHTSGDETITGVKTLVDYWRLQAKNLKAGAGETYGRTGYSFIYTDRNDVEMGDIALYKNSGAARTFIRIRGGDYYTNGVPDAGGTLIQSSLRIGTKVDSTRIIECDTDTLHPLTNNATDLGTSDNKWKSLNGINPGALSFPNLNNSNRIELQTEETEWVKDGTANTYTPTLTGWLNIRIADNAGDFILAQSGSVTISIPGTGTISATNVGLSLLIPAISGQYCNVYVKTTAVKAFIYPCLGNV